VQDDEDIEIEDEQTATPSSMMDELATIAELMKQAATTTGAWFESQHRQDLSELLLKLNQKMCEPEPPDRSIEVTIVGRNGLGKSTWLSCSTS
jgi:signal recognition particle GTPase